MMTEALASIHLNKQHRKLQQKNSNNNNNNNNNNHSINMLKINSAVNMNNMKQEQFKRGGSFVMGQKLRESKWFQHNEINIFCAVIESGFIIELKCEQEENNIYGIAIWTPGYEKSKNPDHLTIYTIKEIKNKLKVISYKLLDFWLNGTSIRINNKSDKNIAPLKEDLIRHQIEFTQHSRKKWHNTEHFAYFCRYGPVEEFKLRKITDQLKSNAGLLFLKIKSFSTSK